MLPIKQTLKPGEMLLNLGGQQTVVTPKQTYIQLDNRSDKLRKSDLKYALQKRKLIELDKALKRTGEVASVLLERTMPSYWIEKTTGENLGSIGRLVTDIATPFAATKGLHLLGKGANYVGKGVDYLARMDMARYGYIPTTKYYFKPGYLGVNSSPVGKTFEVPEGYTFIRELMLNGQLKHIVKDPNGKFKVLEDLDLSNVQLLPKVNLRNYHGEKLTGNESGFDEWARTRIPENDHFPDLSHGINNIRDLLPLMNREFESLPNGSRVDLGHIFSSDSSSNLLLFIRRNNKRIKVVLPESYDEMVVTNDHGIRGADSERIFNELLEKILDLYGYSPDAVPKAVYDPNTNTLSVPKLSFIKLYKKGNKIKWS